MYTLVSFLVCWGLIKPLPTYFHCNCTCLLQRLPLDLSYFIFLQRLPLPFSPTPCSPYPSGLLLPTSFFLSPNSWCLTSPSSFSLLLSSFSLLLSSSSPPSPSSSLLLPHSTSSLLPHTRTRHRACSKPHQWETTPVGCNKTASLNRAIVRREVETTPTIQNTHTSSMRKRRGHRSPPISAILPGKDARRGWGLGGGWYTVSNKVVLRQCKGLEEVQHWWCHIHQHMLSG